MDFKLSLDLILLEDEKIKMMMIKVMMMMMVSGWVGGVDYNHQDNRTIYNGFFGNRFTYLLVTFVVTRKKSYQ